MKYIIVYWCKGLHAQKVEGKSMAKARERFSSYSPCPVIDIRGKK